MNSEERLRESLTLWPAFDNSPHCDISTHSVQTRMVNGDGYWLFNLLIDNILKYFRLIIPYLVNGTEVTNILVFYDAKSNNISLDSYNKQIYLAHVQQLTKLHYEHLEWRSFWTGTNQLNKQCNLTNIMN